MKNCVNMEVGQMSISLRNLLSLVTFFVVLTSTMGLCAESGHPEKVTVNGKTYAWPASPVVVVCIDGGEPEYVNAAMEKELLPNVKKFMADGFSAVAYGAMPSFT